MVAARVGGWTLRQVGTLITEVAGAAVIFAGIVRADLAWVTTGAGLLGAPTLIPHTHQEETHDQPDA